MKRYIIFIILNLILWTVSFGKKNEKTPLIIRDTINITDSLFITNKVTQSEYFNLYEKLLDQKQQHYDSSLTFLSWTAGILAILFTIVIAAGIYLGFNEFRQIKNDLKSQLEDKKKEIELLLSNKLSEESKKVADQLITDKYEQDVTELKERTTNLESATSEIIDSYVLRHEKQKPVLNQVNQRTRTTNNPFNGNQ